MILYAISDLIRHIELMWQNGEIEDSLNGNRLESLAYFAKQEVIALQGGGHWFCSKCEIPNLEPRKTCYRCGTALDESAERE